MARRITPFHVALAFAATGSLYILGSAWALNIAAETGAAVEEWQSWRGWGFILLASVALWLVLRQAESGQTRALESALRAEDRLRMALSAAEGFLWQARPVESGEIRLFATGGLARRLGLDDHRGLARAALLARVHPSDWIALRELIDRIRQGSTPLPDPICRFALITGGWAWVKIVHDPSSRSADPSQPIFGVAFDISDQQGAAQDLAEVIAGGELGTWRLDLSTGIDQINDRWAEMIGYSRAELGDVTTDDLNRLVHPEDLERMRSSHAARMQEGSYFFSEEIRMRHKAGHWVWVLSRGRAVEFCPDGRAKILAGVHVDITRRKALESALRAERDFLQGLAETSVSGILALDETGRVIFTNREAEQILGVTAAQILGRRHDDPAWTALTLDGQPHDPGDSLFQRVTRDGTIQRDQRMMIRLPDGAVRRISINAAPLTAREGAIQVVCTLTDITDQMAAEEILRETAAQALHEALHDPMTGLPNRALFEDQLDMAIRQSDAVTLVFLDVDDFKAVNDRHGHQAGDRLIRMIAQRLEAQRQPGQVLARLAGDEFTLLHPGTALDDGSGLIQALNRVFEAPFLLEDREIWLTAGMGLGSFPRDASDAKGLWRNADLALHEAKARGRNQVTRFSGQLRSRLDEEARIALALRQALRHQAFRLVLQPKVALAAPGQIIGAEVLLRCTDPDLAGIGPDVFMPIAETHGLVGAIDLLVLRKVGEVKASLRAHGIAIKLSVNLSPESLRQPDFKAALFAALAEARLTAEDLIFELTEGTVMDRASGAHDTIDALLAQSFDLSADDFGTGYSSLSYLHSLRLKELKIDRSFIARLGQEGGGAEEIVRAIIAMAQALRLRVVAEGVERAEQADWLHREGCLLAQGFLFGKGVEVEAFLALCGARAPLHPAD